VEDLHGPLPQCAVCGCGTYEESPSWVNGQPDFSNPKIAINARLLDGFDVDSVRGGSGRRAESLLIPSPELRRKHRVMRPAAFDANY
jgi:hypothetical protein